MKCYVNILVFHITARLVTLREMPGATQHQLALALSYTDAAVSLMLGELIKAGFVSVTIDPAHRRKKRVELTAEGVRLADKTHAFLSQKFDNFMAASSIDVAQFNKMITQLYGAAKEQS